MAEQDSRGESNLHSSGPQEDAGLEGFRGLVEQAFDAIAVVDRDDRIVFANRSAVRMTGHEPTGAVGLTLDDIVHPEDMPRVRAVRSARRRGESAPERYAARLVHTDGGYVPVEVTVSHISWNGHPAELVIARDISEEKRVERMLRNRELVLQAVAFAAGELITSDGWEEAILGILERLGQATHADRAYLWRQERDDSREVYAVGQYAWVQTGDQPVAWGPDAERLPLRALGFGPWVDSFERGEEVVGRLDQFPASMQAVFRRRGVRSVAAVPIMITGRWWGVLGFSDCTTGREWRPREMEALQLAAAILGEHIRRQQTALDLARSEERYRTLVDGAATPMFVINADGVYLYANRAAERELDLGRGKLAGRRIHDVLAKDYAELHLAVIRKAIQEGRSVISERASIVRGQKRWYDARIQPLPENGGGPRALVILTDITARKEDEARIETYGERLSFLTSEMSLIEQRERRRIASELDHRIGQTLAEARSAVEALERNSALALSSRLASVKSLLDGTIADTLALRSDLSPPILDDQGLVPAVQQYAAQFSSRYSVAVSVFDDGLPKPLDGDRIGLLYQGILELLVNVAKHARASEVRIDIRRLEDRIVVTVLDNGCGFEPETASPQRGNSGFGLFNLRERLHHLGGELRIERGPDTGARVEMWVPLHDGHPDSPMKTGG